MWWGDEQDGAKVVQEVKEVHNAEVLFVKGDISREAACKQLIDETVNRFGSDWRTPFEKGASAGEIAAYELEELDAGLAYLANLRKRYSE